MTDIIRILENHTDYV